MSSSSSDAFWRGVGVGVGTGIAHVLPWAVLALFLVLGGAHPKIRHVYHEVLWDAVKGLI